MTKLYKEVVLTVNRNLLIFDMISDSSVFNIFYGNIQLTIGFFLAK